MDEKITQASWKPGMEIESEAHYHEVTENLAQELLREYAPEQVATIAAQHIIYSDALTMTIESLDKCLRGQQAVGRSLKSAVLHHELREEYLLKNTASIASMVLEAFKKAKWGKAGKSRKVTAQKSKILDEWGNTRSEYKSRADFARIISKRDNLKERTVYDWIRVHEKTTSN